MIIVNDDVLIDANNIDDEDCFSFFGSQPGHKLRLNIIEANIL